MRSAVRCSATVTARWNGSSGYWWSEANTNQVVVDSMLSRSLRTLTGKSTDPASWDRLFTYFNEAHGKGSVGYRAGEKIAVKINLNNSTTGGNPGNTSLASPQTVLSLLRQLVNNAGFGLHGSFLDLPPARQLEIIQVNVAALVALGGLAEALLLTPDGGYALEVEAPTVGEGEVDEFEDETIADDEADLYDDELFGKFIVRIAAIVDEAKTLHKLVGQHLQQFVVSRGVDPRWIEAHAIRNYNRMRGDGA